jgi:hypothetical protein
MKPIMLVLTASLLFSACTQADDQEIGLNVSTQHDDFFYTAQSVSIQDSIGSMKPKGRFWIVTFRVDNQAKRVQHEWTNRTAFVTDASGQVYENQTNDQQLLNQRQPFGWKQAYVTPARRTDSTRLVFDLPATLQQSYLHYRGAFLMGDAFDRKQFEHTRVRLF